VGDRSAVEAEPFGRLPEVPAQHVLELIKVHHDVGIEGIDVVDSDQARRHVPAMPARGLEARAIAEASNARGLIRQIDEARGLIRQIDEARALL
jgi:hypothetical protein